MKKPFDYKYFKIPIPLYNDKLHIFITRPQDAREIIEKCSNSDLNYDFKNSDGLQSGNMIWLSKYSSIPVLCHEVLHFVFTLLEAKGVKYCDESEEAFCYLHTHLLDKIFKLLKFQSPKLM